MDLSIHILAIYVAKGAAGVKYPFMVSNAIS